MNLGVPTGIRARVHAPREKVIEACERAAETLGRRAKVTKSAANVTINVLPNPILQKSRVSPKVGVSLKPDGENAVLVEARIEKYWTSQDKLAGVIPMGRKKLMGKSSYKRLLIALDQELRHIDDGTGTIEHIAADK